MDKGRTLSGARARFSLQGKVIAYATAVTINEAINYEPLQCIGNIRTLEHVPTGYEVSLTAESFRLVGDTVKSNGFFPAVGQSEEEHLLNILNAGDMTATLEDRKTGKILQTVQQVKLSSHNYTVNARGVVGEQLSFVAIVVKDESEV